MRFGFFTFWTAETPRTHGIQANYEHGDLTPPPVLPPGEQTLFGSQANYGAGILTRPTEDVDVTVNLSGYQQDYSAGQLVAGQPITGQAASTGAGTLVSSVTIALSGSGATWTQGTLGVSGEVDDTFATYSSGVMAVETSKSVSLTGVQGTYDQGTLTAFKGGQLLTSLLGVYQPYTIIVAHANSLTGLQATYGQGNLTQTGGVTPPPPVVTVRPAGGRVFRESFRIRWNGKDRIFHSLDELMEALEEEAQKVLAQAKAKAEKDAEVMSAKGRAGAPPRLKVSSALPEIQLKVDDLQRKIDEVYNTTLFDETARLIEMEDIKFLSDLEI